MRVPRAAGTVLLILALATACAGAEPSSRGGSPIVASATHESIRVTLTLDGQPRTGATSWASVQIENVGNRAVRWAGGGCGDPGAIFIDLGKLYPEGRRDWPEPLARFKRLALGPASSDGMLRIGYVAEAHWGTTMACPAVLRIETLAPGAELSMRAGWDGMYAGSPVPTGAATIEAAFPVIGAEGQVAESDTASHPVGVSIDTVVVGEAGAPVLAPGLGIDAALADPAFAAWVSAGPIDRWINPDVARIGDTWQIGLFKSGAPSGPTEAYQGVVIDGTGHVTAHRSG